MRILWIVNIVMPKLAEHIGAPIAASGSWLIDIPQGLSQREDTEIAIACVYGKEFRRIELDGVTYYLLPGTGKNMLFYTKKYEKLWAQINEEFKPDLVHIHGTEYSHGLSFMRTCPCVPAVISIQGVINRIKDVDFGEIPLRHFVFGRTLKQWLHLNGEIELHFVHKKNAKHESEMFRRAVAVNGCNTWDTSCALIHNPKLRVYRLEYNLRDEFYTADKWSVKGAVRHSVFTTPSTTPLKGLHMLIRAAALLKEKYPDIKIRVPGMEGAGGNVKVTGAYTRYLNRLIQKNGMIGHVEFLGKQTGEQMIEDALLSHVTVIPSALESTSMVLREAMFLGVPCIASFRGGIADFVSDKVDGFLYDFPEYGYLAKRLDELFSDDELCSRVSRAAIEKTERAHARKENVSAYISMYKDILR